MSLLAQMRRVQTYAWSDRFCLPYESAYGRLQKFAWVNVLSASQVAQGLFGFRALPQDPAALKLFNGNWLKKAKVTIPPGLMLEDGLAQAHGVDWMERLCRTDVFRYCERCLNEGFHSLLHQIEGLAFCPRHQRLLQTGCKSCGAEVPLALCKASFAFPFCCPKCLEPFATYHAPQRWAATDEVERDIRSAFGPIVSWLRKLEEIEVVGERAPLSQLSIAGDLENDRDASVCFAIGRQLVPLELSDEMCNLAARPLRMIDVREPLSSKVMPRLEAHNLKKALFRSVSAQLTQTALRGHRRCLHKACSGIVLRSDLNREILEQEPGLCPVAAGFVRWQKRFWAQSAVERKFDRATVAIHVLGPGAEFVADLLAQFNSSVATAYVCECLHARGKRQDAAMGTGQRDLLQRYSCGFRDPDACWEIRHGSGPKARSWVIGSPELISRLRHPTGETQDTLGSTTPNPPWRT